MDSLQRKKVLAGADVIYTYDSSPPRDGLPTLLLLHGCPDTASLWSGLISKHLLPAGYGVIAPDLLGYGSSGKPEDFERYSLAEICGHLRVVLIAEQVETVIVLGHDFGAALASKMYSYNPQCVAGLITLGTAFVPPSPHPFDFQQIKAMQEQYQGYCSMWYFPLFTSENGAAKIEANLEQMFTVLHGGGQRMKDVLCVEGGIEAWLEDSANASAEVLPYAQDPEFRKAWIDRLKKDGWTGPLNWYKAITGDVGIDDEKAAVEAGRDVLDIPYLFVEATQDPLAPVAAVQGLQAQGLLKDVTVKSVEAGHWCMMEKPDEIGSAIVTWLDNVHKGVPSSRLSMAVSVSE
jgi:soluble epoxide hydrolase/lipid-phosphate phosphatase